MTRPAREASPFALLESRRSAQPPAPSSPALERGCSASTRSLGRNTAEGATLSGSGSGTERSNLPPLMRSAAVCERSGGGGLKPPASPPSLAPLPPVSEGDPPVPPRCPLSAAVGRFCAACPSHGANVSPESGGAVTQGDATEGAARPACPVCGAPAARGKRWGRFCGGTCRVRAYRARRRVGRGTEIERGA